MLTLFVAKCVGKRSSARLRHKGSQIMSTISSGITPMPAVESVVASSLEEIEDAITSKFSFRPNFTKVGQLKFWIICVIIKNKYQLTRIENSGRKLCQNHQRHPSIEFSILRRK